LGNDCLFACGWVCEEHRNGPDSYLTWAPDADSEDMMDGDQPDPTASLDAVMALNEQGLAWTLGKNVHHGYWHASCNSLNADGAPYSLGCSSACATPALALLSAILKSRGSHE
jgi:hypothetical protein